MFTVINVDTCMSFLTRKSLPQCSLSFIIKTYILWNINVKVDSNYIEPVLRSQIIFGTFLFFFYFYILDTCMMDFFIKNSFLCTDGYKTKLQFC